MLHYFPYDPPLRPGMIALCGATAGPDNPIGSRVCRACLAAVN